MRHTPHPEVPPSPLVAALERTGEKFLRDFIANLLIAAPMMYANGRFDITLRTPVVGITLWRTYRDVLPEAVRAVRGS